MIHSLKFLIIMASTLLLGIASPSKLMAVTYTIGKPEVTIKGDKVHIEAPTNFPKGTKIWLGMQRKIKCKHPDCKHTDIAEIAWFDGDLMAEAKNGKIIADGNYWEGFETLPKLLESLYMKAASIDKEYVVVTFTVSEMYKPQPKSLDWSTAEHDIVKAWHFEKKVKLPLPSRIAS